MSILIDEDIAARPIHRAEYEALGRAGFFEEEDVELLAGAIVAREHETPGHAEVIRRLTRIVIESVPLAEAQIGPQTPLAMSDVSQPKPDLSISPPTGAGGYRAAHPSVASLVIEVSFASRRKDLGLKMRLYGAAGIPEYWVVDLTTAEVVVHRDPTAQGYATITRHAEGEIRSLRHSALAIDVKALLA